MKKYHSELIIALYITCLVIILTMGISISVILKQNPRTIELTNTVAIITLIAMIILSIICIIISIITVKKVIEPMSRMLKSANPYEDFTYISEEGDELENMVKDLSESLIVANRQKMQTDTILKHMTDGVIAFDMSGNVSYINPAAKYMLELRDTDDTFNKIFSKNEDINMEKIIYMENWT